MPDDRKVLVSSFGSDTLGFSADEVQEILVRLGSEPSRTAADLRTDLAQTLNRVVAPETTAIVPFHKPTEGTDAQKQHREVKAYAHTNIATYPIEPKMHPILFGTAGPTKLFIYQIRERPIRTDPDAAPRMSHDEFLTYSKGLLKNSLDEFTNTKQPAYLIDGFTAQDFECRADALVLLRHVFRAVKSATRSAGKYQQAVEHIALPQLYK